MQFNLFKGQHGGRRPGCGRKRIHSRGVSHRRREFVTRRTPLHINFRYRKSIRNKEALRVLKRAILNARKKGLSVIHFSMQSNHIHLIAEVENNQTLTQGMRSLTITFAKGLKEGRIQVQRYHLHVLRSLGETRNAAFYVLFNQQKHEKGTSSVIDGYTSVLGRSGLIQMFLRRTKMVLRIKRDECWEGPMPSSWLLTKALADEKTPHAHRSQFPGFKMRT